MYIYYLWLLYVYRLYSNYCIYYLWLLYYYQEESDLRGLLIKCNLMYYYYLLYFILRLPRVP